MPAITREIVEKASQISKIHSNGRICLHSVNKNSNGNVFINNASMNAFMGKGANTKAFCFYTGAISYISNQTGTIGNDIQWALDIYKAISSRDGAPKYYRMGYEYAESVLLDLVKHSTLCNQTITGDIGRDNKEIRKFKATIALLMSFGSFFLVSFFLLALVLIGGGIWFTGIVFIELMQGL